MRNITSLLALLIVAAPFVNAQNELSGLYNTGVDNSGSVTSGTDLHYTISSPANTASIGNLAGGSWIEGTDSEWIYPTGNGDETGAIDYETTFNISGPIASADISGQFATDNEMEDVVLNGHDLGIQQLNSGGFGFWTAFDITNSADFVVGTNTLVFETNNDGGPGGVNVELTGTASVPDSASTAWLLAGGLILIVSGLSLQDQRGACRN